MTENRDSNKMPCQYEPGQKKAPISGMILIAVATQGTRSYRYDLRGLQNSANFINTGGGVTNVYDGLGEDFDDDPHRGSRPHRLHQYDREGARSRRPSRTARSSGPPATGSAG